MKRILLKLSGEALEGKLDYGIDVDFLLVLAKNIVSLSKRGTEIIIVIGGGNIFRGISGAASGLDRSSADYMGMLATIMNGIALGDALEKAGVPVRIMSAIHIPKVSEEFIQRRALKHLEKGRIVICVAGTGNPYFTTDSAAVLRAVELHCDVMIKGTKVNGIYNKDPVKHTDAIRYEEISYDEVIQKNLRVLDQSALGLARDENLKIQVCRIEDIHHFDTNEFVSTTIS